MKKILVVNNDFDTMTLLKNWLEKKSYLVRYTSNQDEVPQIINEFRPGLVLVDVLQKKVAENLKVNKKTHSLPVILMTGYAVRQLSSNVLVEDTIEKPFNLPLLEKKIERLIKKTA